MAPPFNLKKVRNVQGISELDHMTPLQHYSVYKARTLKPVPAYTNRPLSWDFGITVCKTGKTHTGPRPCNYDNRFNRLQVNPSP
jgi:hypothetical protein